MNNLIKNILYIEDTAKSIINDANQFVNTLAECTEENKIIMETQILDMMKTKIDSLTHESVLETEKKVLEIKKSTEVKLSYMENVTTEKIEVWTKLVLAEILGDNYDSKNY